MASVGLPFSVAELRDRSALERVRVDVSGFEALRAEGFPHVLIDTEVEVKGAEVQIRSKASGS